MTLEGYVIDTQERRIDTRLHGIGRHCWARVESADGTTFFKEAVAPTVAEAMEIAIGNARATLNHAETGDLK